MWLTPPHCCEKRPIWGKKAYFVAKIPLKTFKSRNLIYHIGTKNEAKKGQKEGSYTAKRRAKHNHEKRVFGCRAARIRRVKRRRIYCKKAETGLRLFK